MSAVSVPALWMCCHVLSNTGTTPQTSNISDLGGSDMAPQTSNISDLGGRDMAPQTSNISDLGGSDMDPQTSNISDLGGRDMAPHSSNKCVVIPSLTSPRSRRASQFAGPDLLEVSAQIFIYSRCLCVRCPHPMFETQVE